MVVEAEIFDDDQPEFSERCHPILTFRDGKIIEDHSHPEPRHLSGIEAAAALFG